MSAIVRSVLMAWPLSISHSNFHLVLLQGLLGKEAALVVQPSACLLSLTASFPAPCVPSLEIEAPFGRDFNDLPIDNLMDDTAAVSPGRHF